MCTKKISAKAIGYKKKTTTGAVTRFSEIITMRHKIVAVFFNKFLQKKVPQTFYPQKCTPLVKLHIQRSHAESWCHLFKMSPEFIIKT